MVSLLPVRLAQGPLVLNRTLPEERPSEDGEKRPVASRGRSLPLRGLLPLQNPHTEIPLRVLQPGLLLRQHLLSNCYVPGTVLSALYALSAVLLLRALEKSPIISFTVWTRKLSQRSAV